MKNTMKELGNDHITFKPLRRAIFHVDLRFSDDIWRQKYILKKLSIPFKS